MARKLRIKLGGQIVNQTAGITLLPSSDYKMSVHPVGCTTCVNFATLHVEALIDVTWRLQSSASHSLMPHLAYEFYSYIYTYTQSGLLTIPSAILTWPYALQDIPQMGHHLETPIRHHLLGQLMLKMQAQPRVHVSSSSAPASTASHTWQQQAGDMTICQCSVYSEKDGAWQTAERTQFSHDKLAF